MARARNIKPAFFLNTDLSEVEPLGRLAFIGLWTISNYKGCLECNFKKIKAQILPYDNCDIELLMNNLEKFRFIRYYFINNKKYIKILNFERHQNPHKNERDAGSDIPDIPENYIEINEMKEDGTSTDKIGSARADSLLLIPDSLIPDSFNPLTDSISSPQKIASPKNNEETELQLICKQTWKSYSDAFYDRYGTEPVRNAKINGQVKNFVKRIGYIESAMVASFYLKNNTQYYVQRGHSMDCLLADAEKIRMEWATGNVMTQTRANQIDKSQANKSAVSEALQILGDKK